MRRSHRGFACVVAASVLAVFVFLGVSACGDEADPDPEKGGAESQALTKAQVSDAAGSLQIKAQNEWPETFAGAWLSEGSGPEVMFAFTEDADRNVEQLAADFEFPEVLVSVDAERSLRELIRLQKKMIDDRELVRHGDLGVPGVRGTEYDLGIDVTMNVVTATAETSSDETEQFFTDRYGDGVLFRQGSVADPL